MIQFGFSSFSFLSPFSPRGIVAVHVTYKRTHAARKSASCPHLFWTLISECRLQRDTYSRPDATVVRRTRSARLPRSCAYVCGVRDEERVHHTMNQYRRGSIRYPLLFIIRYTKQVIYSAPIFLSPVNQSFHPQLPAPYMPYSTRCDLRFTMSPQCNDSCLFVRLLFSIPFDLWSVCIRAYSYLTCHSKPQSRHSPQDVERRVSTSTFETSQPVKLQRANDVVLAQ
ncbi:hypothetical protein K437DRAFT_68814 [Tilletiaria anomala UBC 951]|uniref:Uncharacterized protein n=1 Tax=Tilletiaria anomala (strain ATCC 24038 / CBS 436.72 / UBC 951) TaxID=1037660 RepID=A0A066WH99_TILAU|nr:uncharacterized protein K437DRAFT_68814 [Tilletiaria anomala UBC 951]KDN53342.1 hypothetical protein K437DRAFT_68814 [Tilletiaria anomala UBC 951]